MGQDNCNSVYTGVSGNCCFKECKVGAAFVSTNNPKFYRPRVEMGLAAQKMCHVDFMVETVMGVTSSI